MELDRPRREEARTIFPTDLVLLRRPPYIDSHILQSQTPANPYDLKLFLARS